jgi:DNA (cytosine-5)-methyltransferase 1
VRFFLVASREGAIFQFPPATHATEGESTQRPLLNDRSACPAMTAWDAIGNLTPRPDEDLRVRGRWASLLPSIPEGKNYLWHTTKGGGLPLFG